jgi:hypothetical protein
MKRNKKKDPGLELPPNLSTEDFDLDLTPPPVDKESRFRRFIRLSLRWLTGMAILTGLGFLAAIFLVVQPMRQARLMEEGRLSQANQVIAEQEREIADLMLLTTDNRALQEELASANLQIQILEALVEVNAARYALAMEDSLGTRAHLANTLAKLENLEVLVTADQQSIVLGMRSRLEMANNELENDRFAAQSDLGVLATSLAQLGDSFAAQP